MAWSRWGRSIEKVVAAISNLNSKIPGQIYLWFAVIIFAASNSVTRKLTQIGAQNFVDGRNPISFCNILFAGNICALLVLILLYRRQLNIRAFRQLSRKDWVGLIAGALLSGTLAPGVTFEALSRTMVTNVVLIGRIESPLILALSVWLLRERVNVWEIAGALMSLAGVIVTALLQGLGHHMAQEISSTDGTGEILAAVGAVALAISSIISKTRLARIPVGVFTTFRTLMGTIIFFFAALYVYGSNHFMDVFTPFLWQWMLVYGAIIVAMGQSLWFAGLKTASGSDASLAGAFNPIVAILAAYFILGEVPNLAQYVGGGIILGGVLLSQIGTWRSSQTSANHRQPMETGIGFKGL